MERLVRRVITGAAITAAVWAGLFLTAATASAQSSKRPIPDESYYAGRRALAQGETEAAEQIFQDALADATKVGPVRWIDSICYYAMYGEILFQYGDLAGALEAFESAIDLYLQNRDWLGRVNYPIGPTHRVRIAAPWGTGERPVPVGVFPTGANIVLGDVITKERLRQGGMMAQQEMHRIDPVAILRSTALAIRRRNELLGPLTPYDRRSAELVNCFSTRAVAPNHWSVTWLDVLFGMALQSVGKLSEAENILSKSLLMGGQFDHSLTASALLSLGDGYLNAGKASEAAVCFHEASVAAFQYGEFAEAAEGIEKFAASSRVENRRAAENAMESGLTWAATNRQAASLRLVFLFETAENLIAARRFPEAKRRLNAAAEQMNRLSLATSRWADRLNRLNALLYYAAGEIEAGNQSLNRAMDGAAIHSTRIFQTQTLGRFVQGGNDWGLTPRTESELYEALLRPADAVDWGAFPTETLAFETMLGSEPFENWFVLLTARDLSDSAFEIAERTRQVRYHSALEYGGRPMAIRYLLETPPAKLIDSFRTLRQSLLDEYPVLAESVKTAADLRSKLMQLPILPGEKDDEHRALLNQFYAAANTSEAQIRFIMADRVFVPELFPPQYAAADYQSVLPWDGTLLTFFQARGEYYGFLLTPEIFEQWHVGPASAVQGRVADFLKSIAVTDGSRAKPLKDLTSDGWKKRGSDLLNRLLGDVSSKAARFQVQFKRLTVVPDGVLWYLPFEALCLPVNESLTPLAQIPNVSVTYAPAAGLAFNFGSARTENPFAETVIVPGKLFPKEKPAVQDQAIARMTASLRKAVRLAPVGVNLPSSATAFRFPKLVVLNELVAGGGNWVPYATGKVGGDSIHQWEYLPFGAPETIVLPGFRTAGENALKESGSGSELFVPLMTLAARGNRTTLLTRWRTGGRSSCDLTESFLANLEIRNNPQLAWSETLLNFFDQPLILDEEPRFRGSTKTESLDGHAPFFWAGFLLADRSFETSPPVISPEENLADDNAGDTDKENADHADGEPDAHAEDAQADPPAADAKKNSDDESAQDNSTDEKTKSDSKPSTPETITDEQIERADQEADDFYAPTHQP